MAHDPKNTTIDPFALIPPHDTAPTPPAGEALPLQHGKPPALAVQTEIAPQVVAELRALALASARQFGPAVDLNELADALEGAARWTKAHADAARWADYTRRGTRIAWGRPMRLWKDIAPTLRAYMDRDPELVDSLPATDTFLRAKQRAGRKAAVTRRRRAAEKENEKQKAGDKTPA